MIRIFILISRPKSNNQVVSRKILAQRTYPVICKYNESIINNGWTEPLINLLNRVSVKLKENKAKAVCSTVTGSWHAIPDSR